MVRGGLRSSRTVHGHVARNEGTKRSRIAAQSGCVTHKAERRVGGVEKPPLKKGRGDRRQGSKAPARLVSRSCRCKLELLLRLPCGSFFVLWLACSTPYWGCGVRSCQIMSDHTRSCQTMSETMSDTAVLPPRVCGFLLNRFSPLPFIPFASFLRPFIY